MSLEQSKQDNLSPSPSLLSESVEELVDRYIDQVSDEATSLPPNHSAKVARKARKRSQAIKTKQEELFRDLAGITDRERMTKAAKAENLLNLMGVELRFIEQTQVIGNEGLSSDDSEFETVLIPSSTLHSLVELIKSRTHPHSSVEHEARMILLYREVYARISCKLGREPSELVIDTVARELFIQDALGLNYCPIILLIQSRG